LPTAVIEELDRILPLTTAPTITVEELNRRIEDILNLPVWKRRNEVYAVWIGSQIWRALEDAWDCHFHRTARGKVPIIAVLMHTYEINPRSVLENSNLRPVSICRTGLHARELGLRQKNLDMENFGPQTGRANCPIGVGRAQSFGPGDRRTRP
jgi:hypothetical protein